MTKSIPDAMSPAVRRSIALLSLATFTSMTAQRMCDAMLPELTRHFSASLQDAARVVSFFALTYGLTQMVYGPLGERFGKFRVITFAAMVCAIGSLLATLSDSLDMLVFARVVMSAGAAALISLPMAWIGDAVPPARLQEVLTRTGLGATLGIVSGQLVGGLLTDIAGWRWAFLLLTLLSGTVGVLLFVDLRRQRAVTAAAKEPAKPRPRFFRQLMDILARRWTRIVLLLALVEGAAGFGVLAMWASHLHEKLGLSLAACGAIVALFGLGGVVYMLMARPLLRRLGQQGLVLAGSAVFAVGALLLAFAGHWVFAPLATFVAGFGFFMFHNYMQATAASLAPEARGSGMALFSSSLFLGQSLGVMLAAALASRAGSTGVVSAGGAIIALEGLYFAWALRKRAISRSTG